MREINIEDYINLINVDALAVDKNGKKIAAILSQNFREYKKEKAKKFIKIYGSDLKETYNDEGYGIHSLDFSSDGRLLYIDGTKIKIVSSDESEIMSVDTGLNVIDAKWHSKSILFIGQKNKMDAEDDAYYYEDDDLYCDLYRLDFDSGIKKVTDRVQVWEFATNGSSIAAITSEKPQESGWYRSKVSVISEDGSVGQIYDPKFRQIGNIAISRKGKIAFEESIMSDRGVISGDIIVIDGKNVSNITENSDKSYSHIEFDGENIIAMENEESSFRIKNFGGETVDIGTGIVYPVFSPAFSYGNEMYAYAFSDVKEATHIVIRRNGRNESININGNLRIREYPFEKITWKSRDGTEIYGFLRSIGKDKPLIVYIHGGPTSFSYPACIDRTSVYLGYGFSVFLPNYRGSVGKGRNYAESNIGDLGGMDFEDIMSGIDFLRNNGYVNTDRIYITGGSYGGYMSALAVVKSDNFKASVSLYGISDWISFHGTSNLYEW
ncbi:MAG: alpha/beta hydrolase family protein, partial [Thermoplasmata archaeon]